MSALLSRKQQTRLPRLASLLADGTIFVDGREYVGRAVDGVEVSLGIVDDEMHVERYLDDNPTPDKW